MATTTFDPSEGASAAQQSAETAALEQGEKIAQMRDEDRARRYEDIDATNAETDLIAGKFKSQEDLVKAYEELQKKLGNSEPEEGEEPTEEETEAPEEETPEEPDESDEIFDSAFSQFTEKGEVTPEVIAELSKLPQEELISKYLEYNSKNLQKQQQQQVDSKAEAAILDSVGGAESYQTIVSWAAENLDPAEVASYNEVTNSGNVAAIKFAVEALSNRYKNAEGHEAPLVTGKKAAGGSKVFRSHAELARAISDPRYNKDPAYRNDVEARLARSKDLL
jgi:hypothetical protein